MAKALSKQQIEDFIRTCPVNIKEEFIAVRKSTDLLILSLSNEQLSHFGTASNQPVTANAIGFMVFGHLLHHKKIIEEKYL